MAGLAGVFIHTMDGGVRVDTIRATVMGFIMGTGMAITTVIAGELQQGITQAGEVFTTMCTEVVHRGWFVQDPRGMPET